MKKIVILFVVLTVLIAGIIFAALNFKKRLEQVSINNFEECLALGNVILESYPRQCKTSVGQAFVENIGNILEKTELIRLNNLQPNQEIKSPLVIEGEARGRWYFEASFPIKLFDENNNLIGQAIAQAEGDWMTDNFVPFKAELSFNYTTSTNGLLVLEKDNPSGLSENADQLIMPVKLLSAAEKTLIKVFFNNNTLDSEISCNKVFPVEREVVKTPAIARAALVELLTGTTQTEKEKGFFTSLNPNIKLQKLVIENGVAKVDFNDQLEAQVGGSCRVTAIRAQIVETLKQFLSVKDVIISINSRSEDILQP